MFTYGGLTFMLSANSNEKVQKGKDILVWATLGLVVVFSSYAILKFVLMGITGKTTMSTSRIENILAGRVG